MQTETSALPWVSTRRCFGSSFCVRCLSGGRAAQQGARRDNAEQPPLSRCGCVRAVQKLPEYTCSPQVPMITRGHPPHLSPPVPQYIWIVLRSSVCSTSGKVQGGWRVVGLCFLTICYHQPVQSQSGMMDYLQLKEGTQPGSLGWTDLRPLVAIALKSCIMLTC